MRKFPVWAGMAIGILIGLITTISDGVGLKIVMMAIGALVGTAVGGSIWASRNNANEPELNNDGLFNVGVTPDDLMRDYWRDKGGAPFSSRWKSEYGHRSFDPDNL